MAEKKSRQLFNTSILVLILGGLLLVSTAVAMALYKKNLKLIVELTEVQSVVETDDSDKKLSEEEIAALVEKVSQLIVLPDEIPTVATVADPEALTSQPFFDNSKPGDQVLIYAGAKKAILYSPEFNKILNVAPINIGEGNEDIIPSDSVDVLDESESEEQ